MASKPKVTPQKKLGQKPKVQLPKHCGICNAGFGLFLGRHQCSKCRMIICAHCSVRKTRKDPRVCNRCKPADVSKGVKVPPKNWKCQTCSFENELEHGACFACNSPRPEQGTFHVGAKVNSTFRDKTEPAIIKSENSDGTYNIVFESDLAIALHVPKNKLESILKGQATILLSDIAAITAEIEATKKKIAAAEAAKAKEAKEEKAKIDAASWWCAYCTFENTGTEVKCTMCKQDKPAFSYPFYACGGCTLVNPLAASSCELCGAKKPAPGARLMAAQEAAKNADAILVRDTQQTPVSPTQAPTKKKPGEATLLLSDIEKIQKQIEAAKKFLADTQASKESKEKEEAAEKALADVTETVSATIAEAEEGDTVPELTGAGVVSSPTVTPVKKKKKGVTFGFAKDEPKPGSRLAYARAQTLALKKSKGLGGPAKNKFAITVRSEWLEAEMNVKKMMTEWDELNKKAKVLQVAEPESKSDEKVPETPEPSTSTTTTTETSTPTPTPETPTTPAEGEEHVDAESKQEELFQKLQEEFKSITVEEKEKEKKEAEEAEKAASTPTTAPETPSSPTTETPSSPTTETPASPSQPEEKDMTVEKELLLYLENNKDRYKAFSAHSQEYAQGKLTAFMYYYLIGKTFGDGLVPIVLPLVLKALEGNVKKQEALKCYHQFAMSKSCGLCKKMVYLPEEVRAADKSWHRWCFKCQGTGCTITLDLRTFFAKGGKIYCQKHVPS